MKKFIKEMFSQENLKIVMASMVLMQPGCNAYNYLYLDNSKKHDIR